MKYMIMFLSLGICGLFSVSTTDQAHAKIIHGDRFYEATVNSQPVVVRVIQAQRRDAHYLIVVPLSAHPTQRC